jgi:hypothetical protein
VLDGAQRAKLEHPSSAFAALRHLLPHGEKGNRFTAAANHHRSRLTEALISRLSFSHRGRRGNRFTAAGNHHRSRLTEALISRLSFSPLWEKVAEPERSAGEVG